MKYTDQLNDEIGDQWNRFLNTPNIELKCKICKVKEQLLAHSICATCKWKLTKSEIEQYKK